MSGPARARSKKGGRAGTTSGRGPRAGAAGRVPVRRLVFGVLAVFVLGSFLVAGLVLHVGPGRVFDKVRGYLPGQRVQVTIPEGFDRFQIAERLDQAGVTARDEFLAATTRKELLAALGVSGASAEGYLFPATYDFLVDTAAERVVERLVSETKRRVAALRERIRDVPPLPSAFSEHEWITLASVVEKEAAFEDERPRVAQVFLNRLAAPEGATRGRLQSDPTALYGCRLEPSRASCGGDRVTPEMLRDADNPYNTYRRAGLPPGPVSNPGASSLAAVLAPAGGDELYFVADGTGHHVFSRTFDEHRAAIERLRESAR